MAARQAVFQSERELQSHLARTAARLVPDGGAMLVRREMPVGGCIPDLLLVTVTSSPAESLWPQTFSYRHACVLAELRRFTALHRTTLASRLYEEEDRLDDLISDLTRSESVEETTTGSLRLSEGMRSLRVSVMAIEAKLSRWSEALAQAKNYCAFADRTMVALDAGLFDRSHRRALAQFRRAGVGLCLVDRDGPVLLHPGRRVERATAKREYVCSSVFQTRSQELWMRR